MVSIKNMFHLPDLFKVVCFAHFLPQAHVASSAGGPILQGPGPSVWGTGEAPRWATRSQPQAWGNLQEETDEVQKQKSLGPACSSATVRMTPLLPSEGRINRVKPCLH